MSLEAVERKDLTGSWTMKKPPRYETFLSAVWEGHLRLAMYFISQRINVSDHEDLALILAASRGNLTMVKLLLSQGADPRAQTDTALTGAINNGSLSVTRCLLSHGVDASKHLQHAEAGSLIYELLSDFSGNGNIPMLGNSTPDKLVASYY